MPEPFLPETATPRRPDGKARFRPHTLLGHVEVGTYLLLGIVLSVTAILTIVGSLHLLWIGMQDWTGTETIFELIDRLLLVLMVVELLHTVRLSIRSHKLVVEPFLIIGLIATIRRTLVLGLHADEFTKVSHWSSDMESRFRASMIELGLLSLLILVLVASIYVVRTRPSENEEEPVAP
jgi:uncharacterized membrane protein (DUF373 family)